MTDKPLKGILLLAFGGADSLESVEPFVKNVLKGRPVTPELVAKSVERYKLIGGKSPLLDITLAQAKGIEDVLNSDPAAHYRYKAYVGMRYWHPFIADTVKKMNEDGVTEAVAVIMSPFTSRVATGAYETDVEGALRNLGNVPEVEFIGCWNIDKNFVETIAGYINKELSGLDMKDTLVIFSSHSLPIVALQGDSYEMLVNQAADFIMEKVGKVDYKVAYQSKGSGPREWLGPQTEDVIAQAARSCKKAVIIVPAGFAADHVETLYDIDMLFKEAAKANGVEFRRTPSLNTDPAFIRMLAGKIGLLAEKRK